MTNPVPAAWPTLGEQPSLVPQQRALLAVMVLAFSKSKMREVVGREALATVLDGQLPFMLRKHGVLELEPLWGILKNQPGFHLEDAVPPMLAVKGWEKHLGVYVELPLVFTDSNAMDVWQYTRSFNIPSSEVEAALRGTLADAPPPEAVAVADPLRANAPKATPALKRAFTGIVDVRMTVAWWKLLLTGVWVCAVAGGTYWVMGAESPELVTLTQAPVELRDATAVASDTALVITLTSPAWLALEPVQQRAQFNELMDLKEHRGFDRATLLGPDGRAVAIFLRAINQLGPDGDRVTLLGDGSATAEPAPGDGLPTSGAPGEAMPPPIDL